MNLNRLKIVLLSLEATIVAPILIYFKKEKGYLMIKLSHRERLQQSMFAMISWEEADKDQINPEFNPNFPSALKKLKFHEDNLNNTI